ncbi:Ig-like domain-containing protein [Flavobacterium sp.]|uniref:Ig-like domain-containing protein n=1 Tax=Flavobacterium sp. TaxID=239 RepID=UPI0026200391|nr:Ig-like domain-containing protein [Flavobacterium sp.]
MKIINLKNTLLLGLVFITILSCERELSDDATDATYSKNGVIFTDDFIGMGTNFYFPYSGSKPTAWSVDREEGYNSNASLRFDVPNANDSEGTYAGAIFRMDGAGRNLTGFDALTFYVKASQGVVIDELGFGEDFIENKYMATIRNVSVGTNWTKIIIPIPDASKLLKERGMFRYAAGTNGTGGLGYTFWIDDLKFEKLGTIAHGQASIYSGTNKVETSFIGVSYNVDGLLSTFNMPNGSNQAVSITPAYLNFTSSNPTVASVSELGVVNVLAAGSAVITATFGDQAATGSLTVNSLGTFTSAPTPTINQSSVISIFSNAYNNVPVNYYNGYWQPYQTTQSADFTVSGDNILNYTSFNFVGIEFSSPTVDATMMSHLHLDVYIPSTLAAGTNFKVRVVDFGADGVFGGGNDTGHTTTYTAPTLVSSNWISINIPFTIMTGLSSRAHVGQIIFEGTNLPNFYTDNIYFYNDGSVIPSVPATAAPTPTTPSANVISVFSNAYTNIAGSDLNPNWGQATVTSQVSISGNNTLKYAGLNYQGLQLGSPQNVASKNFLHLDYYSANSTSLKVYLISPGPVEKAVTLTVPSVGGWNSIDIPLSSFSPVNLSNVIQLKFDGNGDIYLDNIYFRD